jgi:Ca2+-binding RTX toxin-like protein
VLLASCVCCASALAQTALGQDRRRVPASAAVLSASEAALLARDDRGLYVAFCPAEEEAAVAAAARSRAPSAPARPRAVVALASHEGWPQDQCLKIDKGPAGASHTLVGLKRVHNWLLGGYGDDTLYAGDEGDVLWGDYQPAGQREDERDYIHGGAGEDWIYSSHGYNEIWTGAGDDHLALVYGHGVVFCNGGGLKTFVMRYLPQNRPWRLVGCSHKVLDRYRA